MGLPPKGVCDNHCCFTSRTNAVPLLAASLAASDPLSRSLTASVDVGCFTCPRGPWRGSNPM